MRLVPVAWVLCSLAASAAAEEAITAPPAPTHSAQPQGDAGRDKTAAQPQNASPAPIVVNVQPPSHTEAEAQKEEQERKEKADLDRRLVELTGDLAYYTKLLAWATIILTVATAGLFAFAIKQARDAKEVGRAARKSAKAAKRSADAAEAALVTAEAPFIFATAEPWREGDPLAPGNRPGFAAITLHNHGRSPAIVRDFYPGTIKCVGLPEPIGYPPPHSARHKDEVIPAGKAGDPWRYTRDAFCPPDDLNRLLNPDAIYWIIGQVRYADAFGAQYVTGFCFAQNIFSGKFYGMGGSRYNYRRRLSKAETREAEASDAELPIRRAPRPSLTEGYATHDTPPQTET